MNTTKQAIINALLELMNERDFDSIKIKDITECAAVSRVSYYRNFTSKQDVILEYLKYLTVTFHNKHYKEDDVEYLTSLFSFIKEYQDFYILLVKNNLIHLFGEHFYKWIGVKEERNDKDAYKKSAEAYAAYGYLIEWIRRGMKQSPQDMAKYCLESIHEFEEDIIQARQKDQPIFES